jgi:ABC-type Mn2+/Zn2+ transport system ATPase subunit
LEQQEQQKYLPQQTQETIFPALVQTSIIFSFAAPPLTHPAVLVVESTACTTSPYVMETQDEADFSHHSNNNNDSGSSSIISNSDEGDGHVSIMCEETSALFDDVLAKRCAKSGETWSSSDHRVKLVWRSVSYCIESLDWKFPAVKVCTRTKKPILHNNSGRIESESLTAVIGPSGAGKSSLLEILAGRREKGVTGSISIHYGSQKHAAKTKIAFMGQQDLFYGNLSVHETLMFASKLKNYSAQSRLNERIRSHKKSNDITITPMFFQAEAANYHKNLVDEILTELFLTSCANVRVSKCSGGQQKRLSIACELISRPDILLLDEPTSGLGQ